MTDNIKEFLDIGLQKYPEAREAVDTFVEAVQEKLRSVFQALPAGKWKFEGAVGLSVEVDYLSVSKEIRLPKQRKAWLTAGLWWDRKLTPVTCAYFATILNSNDVALPFDYTFKEKDISMATDEDGPYLYRPATSLETLESDLKVLIEARLKQPNRA